MSLSYHNKIESLVSAIEDEELRLIEANSMTGLLNNYENTVSDRMNNQNMLRMMYFIKKDNIRTKSWLLNAIVVYEYNLTFYKNRLNEVMEDK